MLYSPGIEFTETSVTPAASNVATANNGVATLGFATRGPINKLVRVGSLSDFNHIFGKPIDEAPLAHILMNKLFSTTGDKYFMRIADASTAVQSSCEVDNKKYSNPSISLTTNFDKTTWAEKDKSYLVAVNKLTTNIATSLTFKITLPAINGVEEQEIEVTLPLYHNTDWQELGDCSYISMNDAVNLLNQDTKLKKYCTCSYALNDAGEQYVLTIKHNFINTTAAGYTIKCEPTINTSDESATDKPTAKWKVDTAQKAVPEASTIGSFDLIAKYTGSSMDGVKVVKAMETKSGSTFSVTVIDTDGYTLESYSGLTVDNFVEKLNHKDAQYINIKTRQDSAGKDIEIKGWLDGTYILGKGRDLGSSVYVGAVTNGDDGYESDASKAAILYVNGLNDTSMINYDESSYSILAIPGIQSSSVNNAMISVCQTRGDAIALIDTPSDYVESGKNGISSLVSWQGDYDNSYAAIYYGWFSIVNPYNTSTNIECPASIFVAPKMIALDNTDGEFYPPAGAQRGIITALDYKYSPDQDDRDQLVGDLTGSAINPIIYSNVRGYMIFAQKTTDKSTSPLNRVSVRRMTNMFKRKLRSSLFPLLFRANNAESRNEAKRICTELLGQYQTANWLESYTVEVTSGTGADRNSLYINLSYAPYGLIEKIYVAISITDAGVETTESV